MSVEVEEGRKSDSKRTCPILLWRWFPHVFLILSLVLYAVFGALIFQHVENKPFNEPENISAVARKLVETVQNHTDASTREALFRKTEHILSKFLNERQYQNWSFYSSLFFCCTLFTTVGYGQMYPVTYEGKVACILYAMVGIPLMLLVISDVGDILAVLLSKAYTYLSRFFRGRKLHRSCIHRHEKASSTKQVQGANTEGTYMFQSALRCTCLQIRNNREIFDRMIIKENVKLKTALTKSYSCPDLNHMKCIRQETGSIKVPPLVILLVVFAYMFLCSQILRCWEKQMDFFDAFYFTFITLTTIGFGDIVPEHPKYFMVTFLFIITGMAIISMAFKLSQSQIFSFYSRCMKFVSMGKVEIHKDPERY